jgi:XRE family transcriptional regulator, fatty acid utilization regulator
VSAQPDLNPGARIAALRMSRHMTQRALAGRAMVSHSLLTKVESGSRPASAALVTACARALGVDPAVLTGRPHDGDPSTRELRAATVPIRHALDLFDLPPEEGIRPRDVERLRSAVRAANRLAQAADYRPMASRLPGLFAELHAAAHLWTGPDQVTAWGLLAEAYRCGHSFGIAMGMSDLSAVALSRMDWAACRAGDRGPGLRAIRDYLRVTAYLREDAYDACWRLNASGVGHLEGTDAATPGAAVAAGQLHLGASVLAARTGDLDGVADHLAEAARIADSTGDQAETFWVAFGPTNVHAHRVTTAVELGRFDEAVRCAETLRFPAGWLPTRIGHHHINLADAQIGMNRRPESLNELFAARAAAPLQARRHPRVRRTVGALVRSERRRGTRLATYVAWLESA